MHINLTTKQKQRVYAGERILPDAYPVYVGYTYLVDDRIEISDVTGDVFNLKSSVLEQGRTVEVIRSCSWTRIADIKEDQNGT
jgi:hypothetical protein